MPSCELQCAAGKDPEVTSPTSQREESFNPIAGLSRVQAELPHLSLISGSQMITFNDLNFFVNQSLPLSNASVLTMQPKSKMSKTQIWETDRFVGIRPTVTDSKPGYWEQCFNAASVLQFSIIDPSYMIVLSVWITSYEQYNKNKMLAFIFKWNISSLGKRFLQNSLFTHLFLLIYLFAVMKTNHLIFFFIMKVGFCIHVCGTTGAAISRCFDWVEQ